MHLHHVYCEKSCGQSSDITVPIHVRVNLMCGPKQTVYSFFSLFKILAFMVMLLPQ